MPAPRPHIRIVHAASGALIASGPLGYGITAFDGGLYIRRQYLREGRWRPTFAPGLCPYKLLYVWLAYLPPGATDAARGLGWMYVVPNPALPFLWWRVAVPGTHPELLIEEREPGSTTRITATPAAAVATLLPVPQSPVPV